MNKPTKVFIISIAVVVGFLTLLVYLTLTLAGRPENRPAAARPSVDMVKLEADYKTGAKTVVADFLALTASGRTATSQEIRGTKDRLLSMTVPPALKDLHLDLVLAIDKMIAFLEGEDTKGKVASLDIINQAKSTYNWLN